MPQGPSLLRFSTEMLPERDRFSVFREEFARKVMNMDVVERGDAPPRMDLSFLPLGRVAVGSLVGTAAEFIRDRHHVKDGTDDFFLLLVDAGTMHVSQAGRDSTQGAGGALFLDYGRVSRVVGVNGGSIRNVTVAPSALKALVVNPEDLAGRLVQPGPALRLLDGYLRALTRMEEAPSPDLAEVVSTHILDLMAAALGPTSEAEEVMRQRGLRAGRLRAIQALIAQRFSDPNFDLDDVTGEFGVSARYVQRLFEETGKSFTDHLVERRLERAYAMLTDRRYLHMRITEIALEVGFGDISYFNRMFRRRFGDTPTGARASAGRE